MKLRKQLVANFMVAVLMLSAADVTVLAVDGQQGMEGVLQESEVQASVESQKDEKNSSGETDEKKISEMERTGASSDEEQPEGEAPDNENLTDNIEEENKDEETVSGNEMFDEEEKAEEDNTISSNGIEESLSADGASAQAGYFTYELNDKNEATITGYSELAPAEEVTIPSTLDGHLVVAIGAWAFKSRTVIKSVVIPDSVTEIDCYAFEDCVQLNSVKLSKNLTNMRFSAFRDCHSLTSIEIPKSLETSDGNSSYPSRNGAFNGCENLKTVTFEEGATRVAENLFANCTGLETIVIPDTVTTIGGSAFSECSNLGSVTISSSVTQIGNYAFEKCTSLKEAVIPDSVTEIGCYAFDGCTQLNSVELSKNLTNMRFSAFRDCHSLTSIEIPKSLETSDGNSSYPSRNGAFNGCENLKTVTFEEGTTRVAENLFANCTGLETIVIPDTVTTIGGSAFSECSNLDSVTISSSVTQIGNYAFEKCTSLKEAVIPDSVTEIGCYAFDGCTQLNSVELSKNLTNMRFSAFRDCHSLTSIEIPKSLETSEGNLSYPSRNGAFNGCENLKTVTFEEGTTRVVENLFANCTGLETITIPDTVTAIEREAFNSCDNLNNVTVSSNVTKIGYKAFAKCKSLVNITLPESLVELGNSVFQGCTSLAEITIPAHVTSMGTDLCADCSNLEKAVLQNEFNKITEYCFQNCSKLKSVIMSDSYAKIEKYAFQNCNSLNEMTWPKELTGIGTRALENTAFTEVVLPNKLMEIGNYAFFNCDSLIGLTIPDSVTSLGTYVFSECEKLSDVKLSAGLTKIPQYAFHACPSLTKLVLPYRVTTVESNAFTNCTSFTEITIPRATTSIQSNAVSYPTKMTVYGISGTYAEEWARSVGATFVNREVMVTSVTFEQELVTLNSGQTVQLIITVIPSDFMDEVVWSSSDDTIAAVDDRGNVTGKALGEATISVMVGGVSATCKVAVVQPATGITLNKTALSLRVSETARLTATIDPAIAQNKKVTWSSSDESIVTVDVNGLVTAVAKGEAVITATVQDGSGVSGTCKVTVSGSQNADQPETPDDSEGVLKEDIPEGGIPQGLWISAIAEQEYTGKAIKPDVRVYDGDKRLEPGKDYTIGYKNNIKAASESTANAPVVTIKGKGNYSGTVKKGFTITSKNICDTDLKKSFTNAYELPADNKNPKLLFLAKYKNRALKINRDYMLTIKDNRGLSVSEYSTKGFYWLVVEGCGNYTGSLELFFEVSDKTPVSKLKVNKIAAVEYTGKDLEPKPIVKDGATVLTEGTDYSLEYENNVDVGSGNVLITGMGNYLGTRAVAFTIKGRPMNKVKVESFMSSYVYTGKAIFQSDSLTLINKEDGEKLKEGTDYRVIYSANSKAGKVTVSFIGMGRYVGTLKKTYQITPYNINRDTASRIHWQKENIELPYCKGGVKPKIKLYDGTKLLIEGTDYTLSYKNNKVVGAASVEKRPEITVKGKGNYIGVWYQKIPFTIFKKNIDEVSIGVSDVEVSTEGGKYKPTLILTDTDGKKLDVNKDYDKNFYYTYRDETEVTDQNLDAHVRRRACEPVGATDIIPVNTVLCIRVDAKTDGNYKGSLNTSYRIVKKSINKAKITVMNPEMNNRNQFAYTGRKIIIEKKNLIVNVNGVELSADQYEILEDTYKNNQNKGTASVQIRGLGDYGGTATVKYKIGTQGFRWAF